MLGGRVSRAGLRRLATDVERACREADEVFPGRAVDRVEQAGERLIAAVAPHMGRRRLRERKPVKPTFLVINDIVERIGKGDVADLVAVSPPQWEALRRDGKIDPEIQIAIAKVGYGVFVKKGAARPDISSVEALKRSLLNARSIAFFPPLPGGRRGPTGAYQVRLVEQLGISADIKQKIVESSAPRPGQVISAPIFELVASGGAEIGVAMISDLLQAPEVDFVGPVPPEVRDFIVFTTGIPTIAREPAAAKAFIAFLTSPSSSSFLNSKGLEQP